MKIFSLSILATWLRTVTTWHFRNWLLSQYFNVPLAARFRAAGDLHTALMNSPPDFSNVQSGNSYTPCRSKRLVSAGYGYFTVNHLAIAMLAHQHRLH
jgi:hypothetical protein